MKQYIANSLTGCRIIFSVIRGFFSVFSFEIFLMYTICGITDMLDGLIARKTKSATVIGSYWDSFADFVFILSALIIILPAINVSVWLWMWISLIAVIKIANVLLGFVRRKKILVEHTFMNRLTGLLLFLLPFTFSFIELKYSTALVCSVATLAAIQETYYINKGIII